MCVRNSVHNCGLSRTIGSLKILNLNVCGIKSKLNCPELINLILSYDVIGVKKLTLYSCQAIVLVQPRKTRPK